MKRKEIKDVIKKFTYKNKKSLCIFMVLAVLAGGIVIVKINSYKSQQTIDSENYARTVFVEKGEINRSINVNGKIESAEVSMVSTSLTEKVKSVNVKVGDYVKAGDVICTLDDGDITKEIEKKKSEIAENKKELEANYNKLSNQLKEAKNVKVSSVSAQDNVVSNLKSNYENTENDLNNYDGTYKKIQNTYNTMLSAIESKVNNYNEAENIKNSAYNAWIASGGNASSNEYVAYKSAEENLNNKQRELEEAKQLYNYEEIKESYNAALAIFNEKISNRNLAKEQYEAAVANRLSVINSADGEISNLESSVNDAYKQLQKADDNEELKNLEERLSKTVLKAETDGKVTELKVKVGAVPEGQVATIQSDNKLIISVIIPEYEIKNAKVGMNALITTNSSDKKISGKLTRISPTANAGETSGFSADIAIDDAKDLYIGTNAKAEIIVSEKKNILMVPKDAVKEVGGKYFLMVKGKDNQFIETEVTLGEENDYYVEVSGSGIKEGSEILADLTNYNETTEGVENESKGEA